MLFVTVTVCNNSCLWVSFHKDADDYVVQVVSKHVAARTPHIEVKASTAMAWSIIVVL